MSQQFHCPADWHFSPPCVEIVEQPPISEAPRSVPEPDVLALLAIAIVAAIIVRRRK